MVTGNSKNQLCTESCRCGLLSLTLPRGLHYAFESHPRFGVYQWFVSLSAELYFIMWTRVSLFIRRLTEHLDGLQYLAIVNKAATNFHVQSLWIYVFISIPSYFHINKPISCLFNPYSGSEEWLYLIYGEVGTQSRNGLLKVSHTASSLVEV